MIKKNQNKLILISAFITIFIVSKFMWWTLFVSLFLSISLPLLFILWRTTWKSRVLAIISWLFLIWIDFFLLLLLIIPTNSYNIQVKEYYKNKDNYIKVFIKDNKEKLTWMAIKINNKINPLTKYKKWEKIKVKENDTIYFIWRKKNKSYAVIYLWDDSIIRLTPWTKINLNKITKNLNDMTANQTHITLEQWSIWFHIIKMVKDSSNMKIANPTGQELIIRWTAWIVSFNNSKTKVIWYSHFIEVKSKQDSKIIGKWEWAIIENNKIKVTHKIQDILNSIWIDNNLIKDFKKADKKYIEQVQKQMISYIKEQIGILKWVNIYNKLKEIKIKVFSIGDQKYKKYADNLIDYKYLIWKSNKFTKNLAQNDNLVFLASELNKQKVKTAFLYNKLKNNIKNSDIYKTYIVNLWIEWKISNISKLLKENAQDIIDRYSNDYEQLFRNIDNWIINIINKYLNF